MSRFHLPYVGLIGSIHAGPIILKVIIVGYVWAGPTATWYDYVPTNHRGRGGGP